MGVEPNSRDSKLSVFLSSKIILNNIESSCLCCCVETDSVVCNL